MRAGPQDVEVVVPATKIHSAVCFLLNPVSWHTETYTTGPLPHDAICYLRILTIKRPSLELSQSQWSTLESPKTVSRVLQYLVRVIKVCLHDIRALRIKQFKECLNT